jgi:glycosyltransferase involved in cell wall biosynthesis
MSTLLEPPRSTGTLPGPVRERAGPSCMSAPELCVHALAQARDEIELELPAQATAGVDLGMIVTAYGLHGRVRFEESTNDGHCRFAIGNTTLGMLHPGSPRLTLGALVESISAGMGGTQIPAASDELLAGHRIVVLTNYPTHYRLPLFELMAGELEAAGARFRVLFLAPDARSRPWLTGSEIRFDHEFVPSLRLPLRHRHPLLPVDLERRLKAWRPTIILSAGLSPFVSNRAAKVARQLGASFGIWSGETSEMATARSPVRRRLRRHLVLGADFAIAYGARGADYLRVLRPDLRLVVGRNSSPVHEAAPTNGAVRAENDPVAIVLIGDLADSRKGVDVALAALRLVQAPNTRLSIIGGGRLLNSLVEDTHDVRVRFLGPLAPNAVARELADADVLLFPTRADVFGLVLVEAMGVGLLPIVSRAAGAVDDLAVDGHNAVVVDGHEPATWAAAIEGVLANPALRRQLAERARETIEARWSLRHAAGAMIAGLRLGVLSPRKTRRP